MPPFARRSALWLLLLAPATGAEPATTTVSGPPATNRISRELARQIIASLPRPPPFKPAEPAQPTDSADLPADVVRLPEMRVIERPLPGNPDAWLTPKALQQKAVKEYLNAMTSLDRVLNGWHIPYLTPSVAVRARAAYEGKRFAEEMNRIAKIVDAVAKLDPAEAAKLRREMRPYP